MSKRKIIAAAKKAGYRVLDAHYDWVPTPGEMVPQWSVTFEIASREFDPDYREFESTAEAIEYFRSKAAEPCAAGEHTHG